MKSNKRTLFLSLFLVSILVLSGCSTDESSSNENVFQIGISQLAQHPALDDARLGFEEGLEELGVEAEINYQNAQGEIPNTVSIAQKFVKDEVDLIYTIATSPAQSAKQATTEIPILFSAVTDPVAAELVETMDSPGGNITGTSDESPMYEQLKLFKDLDSTINKVGIIFNTSEENSNIQLERAKEIGKELGIEIVEVGISTTSDIPQAVDSIIKKVDGIYTITDNMVASAINVVAEKAIENNMITVGAEDAHIKGGILLTNGISYYELGKQTAEMAKQILVDGKSPSDIPSASSENTKKTFNKTTLEKLGLDMDNEVFSQAEAIEE